MSVREEFTLLPVPLFTEISSKCGGETAPLSCIFLSILPFLFSSFSHVIIFLSSPIFISFLTAFSFSLSAFIDCAIILAIPYEVDSPLPLHLMQTRS